MESFESAMEERIADSKDSSCLQIEGASPLDREDP